MSFRSSKSFTGKSEDRKQIFFKGRKTSITTMNNEIECRHKDIEEIKERLEMITNFLKEDYELSDELKEQIEEARNAPDSEFIDHDELMKELLK